jgi:hypothetical protein
MFTVNHFKLEKVPERTIYGIIQRAENNITAKRTHGSGRIAKKMNKRALNRLKRLLTIVINCPSDKQADNSI